MKKNNNILFKELDLAVAYIIIFIVGILIVFLMTLYINSKVNEFSNEMVTSTSK